MYSATGQEAINATPRTPRSKGQDSQSILPELSETGAAINLLKFVIGLGIISLPEATKHIGWLPSIVGLGVMAFVTVWGILFALKARDRLNQIEQERRDINPTRAMTEGSPLTEQGSWQDLPDVGGSFFEKILIKVWGRPVQFIFGVCIVLGQFTTLVIYLNVITENFESYFISSQNDHKVYHLQILLSVVCLLGMFSLIPTLRGVAVLSALGLSIYSFLFIGLLHEFFLKAQDGTLPASAHTVLRPTLSHYGEWFGVSCFAFSAFPIAMEIHEEMRDPRAFVNVLWWCFLAIWCAYSSFAVLGYLCYGSDTDILIYFNWPAGSAFREAAAGAVACIICFTFVVQAVPIYTYATRALECTLESSQLFCRSDFAGLHFAFIRWTVLALTVAVAYMVPSVKVMMNTVGAVSGVACSFVIPAATYLKLSSRDAYGERALSVLVIFVGVLGAYYSCISPNK